MKPFLLWLAMAAVSFSGLGGGYHAYLNANPHKLLVVVDASFAMQPAWSSVGDVLSRLEDRRYTSFSLFTERSRVHGWSTRLHPGKISPYGPRDFSRLVSGPQSAEMTEASEKVLITNASGADLDPFDDWVVIRVPP